MCTILGMGQTQLAQQGLPIDTNTHRREFDRPIQHMIPHQQVAIESHLSILGHRTPVVIVRCTAVVSFAIAQRTTDTDDKDGTIGACDGILPLFRCQVGILLQQVIGMDEMDLCRQCRTNDGEHLIDQIFRPDHSGINASDNLFQELDIPLFRQHHALPVPLIDIQRVQVAQLLIASDGIHIRIDTIARLDLIVGQRQPFPLGQRMDNLSLGISQILDRKGNSPFRPVQVIIDTHTFEHEQRCGHTPETQLRGQVLLEKVLDLLDTHFCLGQVQKSLISSRFN